MDDRERLIRLLMLIERQVQDWHQPVAARRLSETIEDVQEAMTDRTAAEVAGNKLARMTKFIRQADRWHRSGGTQGDQRDAYQLPGFVLEAVSALPGDVVLPIGSWVASALGLDADAREVGQIWVDDAKTTAWRLLIEHGHWPGHHTAKREPLIAE